MKQSLNDSLKTQKELMYWINALGFDIPQYHKVVNDALELEQYYNEMQHIRADLDYDIDGLVYKINNRELQEKVGYIAKAPRWAIARKFPAETAESEILSVDFQVGRTGALTPVARLKPVTAGGVVISSATLHNMNEILKKDLFIGDRVIVRRAGDVIPEVVSVIIKSKNRLPIEHPSRCPSCGSLIDFNHNEAALRCKKSWDCPSQKIAKIKHFCSKKAFNIKGVGDKLVNTLVKKNMITYPEDLFSLKVEDLLSLDRMAIKSASNIIDAIKTSKKIELHRFIYALGIPEVGEVLCKKICSLYKTLEEMKHLHYDELFNISDMGHITANNWLNFWSNIDNYHHIEAMLSLGLNIDNELYIDNVKEDDNKKHHFFYGKSIVITGSFSSFSREEIKNILEKLGSKVLGSISNNTDVLCAGDKAGSKLVKAQSLGIKIINEETLITYLEI